MKIAIIGIVGVPGRYGGFETLAENLVRYHARNKPDCDLTVWCSSKDSQDTPPKFGRAELRYVNLKANGIQSVLYDAVSLFQAVRSGHDQIVMLGVSGAIALPFVRLVSRARIITNVDGIEWKRPKWGRLARAFLKVSERLAVRFSHVVIADNQAISDYVRESYGVSPSVISYGGDHAVVPQPVADAMVPAALPDSYALALCRVEPENNLNIILEAFAGAGTPIVVVGNWSISAYGRDLKQRYENDPDLYLLDPIYDAGTLFAIRSRASVYLHGHSAGGTNPSLVEMMHFGTAVLAFDCPFNRFTTDDKAAFFRDAAELRDRFESLDPAKAAQIGEDMKLIATARYTWDLIGAAYFDLLGGKADR